MSFNTSLSLLILYPFCPSIHSDYPTISLFNTPLNRIYLSIHRAHSLHPCSMSPIYLSVYFIQPLLSLSYIYTHLFSHTVYLPFFIYNLSVKLSLFNPLFSFLSCTITQYRTFSYPTLFSFSIPLFVYIFIFLSTYLSQNCASGMVLKRVPAIF